MITLDQVIKMIETYKENLAKPVEYRLYYDDMGKVICYTTENREGNYIVITKEQYSESRMDVYISEGKIFTTHRRKHLFKMTRSTDGQKCSIDDVSIIVDDNSPYKYWKLQIYEIE